MEYECKHEQQIQKIIVDLDGNGKLGLKTDMALSSEKLNSIIITQQKTATWVKWGLSIVCALLIGALSSNISDHYKVKEMSDKYASKEYLLRVLAEMQRSNQLMESTALNNKDDILELRRNLEYNNNFLKQMSVTRGSEKYKPPIAN